jgi:DinB superfamily
MESLQFPIGKFTFDENYNQAQLEEAILTIAKFPAVLNETLAFLPEGALNDTYRPDGWTGRQVIHHLADSHMNCLLRFKWTLTEVDTTIKPYAEAKWAELPDSVHFPIGASLQILHGVHQRLSHLMTLLTPEQRKLRYFHPENQKHIGLDEAIFLYAWHCKHHLGHLLLLKKR